MDYFAKEDAVEYVFEKIKHFILPSENNNYKSRFLQSNLLLYCVVLLLALKIVTVLVSINIPQNIFFADITKVALESFVNQTRQSLGLQPLLESEKLNQAAKLKAQNMVQYQYFNHTSPSGVSPWFWFLQAGYKYKYAGENLAIGFFESEEVYQAWLNSPSHKENILNPNYTEVGTAVLSGFGGDNTIVVVQEFASPLTVKSPSNISTKKTATVQSQTKTNIAVETQPKSLNQQEQVLSQSTKSQNSFESPSKNITTGLPAKLLNVALYDYDNLLQDIIYGVALVLIGILLVLIFFNFNVSFKKQLVFRAVLLILLLYAAMLFNKDIIISLIPHQVII